jgi:hypothetical protein
MKHPVVVFAASIAALAGTALADPARIAGTVTDIFGHRFVVETPDGKVLVDVGPKGAEKFVVKRGDKIEIEGDRNPDELRARRVTLADGHAYEVDKPGKSWREWLTGKRPPQPGTSSAEDAKRIATEKGYQVTGDPVATKKHFKVMASKDGRNYELQVHGDGRIEQRPAFGAAEAKRLAADKGYQLTTDPVPVKEHFQVTATKDGKRYEVDVHRDGNIVARSPFGPEEANKLVTDKGYEIVGELRPVDRHFELLGKKDGKFYELHAHRDDRLVRARLVDATDPKWGQLVR